MLKPLHGCGGSEGYVLDVDLDVARRFWQRLQQRYPKHAGLCRIAADAALLAGRRDAARALVLAAARLEPATLFSFCDDLDELFAGSREEAEYRTLKDEIFKGDAAESSQKT